MMQIRLRRKWLIVTLLSVFLCFVLVPSSFAVEIFDDETVVIEAGEVIDDDLMVFANELILDGTVKGDLLFFGNKATINGLVEGDLMGGGQEIVLNGNVNDDVRLGAMIITLGEAAQVGDDLMAGAYSLESKAGSLVEGDMFYGGAQSRLAGDMAGDLWVSAGGLELLGNVDGDVRADVGSAADAPVFSPFAFMPGAPNVPAFDWGLTLSDQAQIGGDLHYVGPAPVEVPADLVAGEVSYEQVVTPAGVEEEVVPTPAQEAWNWLANVLRELVTLLVIGVLMVWLLPSWTNKVSAFVQEKPLPSLGWGLLAIAVIFVAIVLVGFVMVMLALALGALTLDGLAGTVITVGLFTIVGLALLFAFTVAYFAKIIVAVASGRFIFNRFNSRLAESGYWSMALGVLLIVILTAIPWIGALVSLFVILLGFGALWQEGSKGWQVRFGAWRMEEPAPEAKVKPA